ncbi:carbohydrate binding domain-containing protein [Hymenobacter negativus]|uniref:Carbohydrate binding domain-containing protein n=1 Tax=Hymenobacter negativus TaxID=2795026 RepID=A0ABS3QAQ1_9BACT|nr:carbohydrate binding domain-containing protein [Hymenobacter negativus]MBO2008312.1 carbohydrate binding domain-containing protein [Hymenobacter negativus]
MLLSIFASVKRSCFRVVAGSALLLGVASCSSDSKEGAAPANLVSKNDFEACEGWGVTSTSLTSAKAHSGRYSIKVDPGIEYSIGYANTLGKMSSTKIKKLHVSGWAMLSSPKVKAVLVLQITDPAKGGAQIYWQALNIRAEVKTINHWTQIEKDFDLPDTISSNQELKLYMWRTGPDDTTYLDDVEITKG